MFPSTWTLLDLASAGSAGSSLAAAGAAPHSAASAGASDAKARPPARAEARANGRAGGVKNVALLGCLPPLRQAVIVLRWPRSMTTCSLPARLPLGWSQVTLQASIPAGHDHLGARHRAEDLERAGPAAGRQPVLHREDVVAGRGVVVGDDLVGGPARARRDDVVRRLRALVEVEVVVVAVDAVDLRLDLARRVGADVELEVLRPDLVAARRGRRQHRLGRGDVDRLRRLPARSRWCATPCARSAASTGSRATRSVPSGGDRQRRLEHVGEQDRVGGRAVGLDHRRGRGQELLAQLARASPACARPSRIAWRDVLAVLSSAL